ncbi:MAG: hypothetical protein AAB645_02200 [Patescibacteria group bacterium]
MNKKWKFITGAVIVLFFIVLLFSNGAHATAQTPPTPVGGASTNSGGAWSWDRIKWIMSHSSGAAVVSDAFSSATADWLEGQVFRVMRYSLLLAVYIASLFTLLVGVLLDYVISITLYSQFWHLASIEAAWFIIRDIANIFFIFVLLYIAIATVLDLAETDTKKMLVAVIIAAVLLNFSLMFTRVIIDVGNVLADQFYQSIAYKDQKLIGFSSRIVDAVKLQDLNKVQKDIVAPPEGSVANTQWLLLYITFLSLIFYLMAAWTFLRVGFMFQARMIILLFLMVTSPIAYLGSVVPQLSEYSKGWWSSLIHQTMVAPVFLFFAYLIVRIAENLSEMGQSAISYSFQKANQSTAIQSFNMEAVFTLALVIGLLWAALTVTKKLSGEAGNMATKFGTLAAGLAVGAATGGTSLALKAGGGALASKIAKSGAGSRLASMATSSNRLASWAGKAGQATLEGAQKGSWDIRRAKIPGLGKVVGKDMAEKVGFFGLGAGAATLLNKQTGIDIGKGKTPAQMANEKEKEAKEKKEGEKAMEQTRGEAELKQLISIGEQTGGVQKQIRDALKKLPDVTALNIDLLKNHRLATQLSKGDLKIINDSRDITRGNKTDINKASLEQLIEAVNNEDKGEIARIIGDKEAPDAADKLRSLLDTAPKVADVKRPNFDKASVIKQIVPIMDPEILNELKVATGDKKDLKDELQLSGRNEVKDYIKYNPVGQVKWGAGGSQREQQTQQQPQRTLYDQDGKPIPPSGSSGTNLNPNQTPGKPANPAGDGPEETT